MAGELEQGGGGGGWRPDTREGYGFLCLDNFFGSVYVWTDKTQMGSKLLWTGSAGVCVWTDK